MLVQAKGDPRFRTDARIRPLPSISRQKLEVMGIPVADLATDAEIPRRIMHRLLLRQILGPADADLVDLGNTLTSAKRSAVRRRLKARGLDIGDLSGRTARQIMAGVATRMAAHKDFP